MFPFDNVKEMFLLPFADTLNCIPARPSPTFVLDTESRMGFRMPRNAAQLGHVALVRDAPWLAGPRPHGQRFHLHAVVQRRRVEQRGDKQSDRPQLLVERQHGHDNVSDLAHANGVSHDAVACYLANSSVAAPFTRL